MKKPFLTLFFFSLLAAGPAALDARLTPQRTVLENGLVLLTSEQKALPMVTFNLVIRAGSRYDPEGRAGAANMTVRLLSYGTRSRSALEISETLDFIGAELSTDCAEELATVSLTLLKKDLAVGLDLLAEILSASVFPAEEIDRQRQSVIASIKAREEEPGAIAERKFLEALFPRSPYGRPVEGSEETVRRVEREDLLRFYRQYYRPDRAIMAVVGDISHREIKESLARALRPWQRGVGLQEAAPKVPVGPANFLRVNKSLAQANIVIGHEGVSRAHPDYYAIQVMNYILGGGGFSSRLMGSVRNERGLAYSVYSQFDADKHVGTFQITMQTKNESADEAIRIATEEIRRIREKGVEEEELQAAKDYLIGSFPLRFDTNRRLANFFAQVEFFELGADYPDRYPELIRQIRHQDIQRVAARYLSPERLIVVVVADQAKSGLSR